MNTKKNRPLRWKAPIAGVLLAAALLLASCGTAGAAGSNEAASSASTSATTQSGAPGGTPPGGTPPSGGAPGGQTAAPSTDAAAYSLAGGTAAKSGQTYTASSTDESAVYVSGAGALALSGSKITTSGNTSSNDASSFYGLNAAVLAAAGGKITLSDSTIITTGSGANGAFATGTGSSVTLSNVTIDASGRGGHGVMATQGAILKLSDVTIVTRGANSAPIATDRGGGTVTVTGGTVTASGADSPAIYSTGALTVTGGTMTATGAEAAAIEGANSITLIGTALSTTKEGKWGVLIYQSMSGDAEGARGIFMMTGGSLTDTSKTGPLFYVTNSTGVITLKGVKVDAASGILVKAAAGTWGTSGSNGGTVILTADGQVLKGSIVVDGISSVSVVLKSSSSLTGAINTDKSAGTVSLELDASSTWTVTADSSLAGLKLAGGITGSTVTGIIGNGHTVTYDTATSPDLGGKTYSLSGGGVLKPSTQEI